MKESLKNRLVDYLRRNGGWVASGELERLVKEHTTYTASNATRRLREAVNEGLLEVKHVRGHSHYKIKTPLGSEEEAERIFNSL